jgi:hypothetical protein
MVMKIVKHFSEKISKIKSLHIYEKIQLSAGKIAG